MAEENSYLICPITLEYFVDPITTPCGHSFTRLALITALENSCEKKCPLCNELIPYFDAIAASKNIILSKLVEEILAPKEEKQKGKKEENEWSCFVTPVKIEGPLTARSSWAELNLSLGNSTFVVRPTLLIMIVDISGSMYGDPMRQVREALKHTIAMTHGKPFIQTRLITYESIADLVPLSGTIDAINQTIQRCVQAGGGNNEEAAFRLMGDEVLRKYKYSDDDDAQNDPWNVSNVTIAFLTDGQAYRDRKELIDILQEVLDDNWFSLWGEDTPLTIHTIGFSRNCDREFLEDVRQQGSIHGVFRYAEPQDNDNALCEKLQSLFESVSSSSTISIKIQLLPKKQIQFQNEKEELDIQFPVGANKKGSFKNWVKLENEETEEDNLGNLKVMMENDYAEIVPIQLKKKTTKKMEAKLATNWMSHRIDHLASEIMELVENTKPNNNLMLLHCALLQQRVEALSTYVEKYIKEDDKQILQNRLEFVSEQIELLKKGKNVHMGKLGDLRFSSQFNSVVPIAPSKGKRATEESSSAMLQPLAIKDKTNSEKHVRYSYNNEGKKRNKLQETIIRRRTNQVTAEMKEWFLKEIKLVDIYHQDVDGNNAVHLAAYSGQNLIMNLILQHFPELDLGIPNRDKETPMTLAIKGRGFWKILKILLKHKCQLPNGRKERLEQYAINNGYEVTAKILSGIGENAKEVSHTMTSEYVKFCFESAEENNLDINVNSYLDVALAKGLEGLVKKLIPRLSEPGSLTLEQLFDYCIPPKPDSLEVERYLRLTKLVCEAEPSLIFQKQKGTYETALFKAAERGNLPHVTYFLKKGAELDGENAFGNTPLWIACAKRYPCIISELLSWGADVNHANDKGNVPLYPLCQKQNTPIKIVKQLLSAHAKVNYVNPVTEDTLILICCRNNKSEILALLLNYVDFDFVNYRAPIDGFDAMMAATEANNPDCIQVLYDFGVTNLEIPTADDNPILSSATALHLAAYYNCPGAAEKLLSLKANPNSVNRHRQTPMHIAVIQGNISILKMLLNHNGHRNARDEYGSTPLHYCRNGTEIRDQLEDPATDILLSLARGQFGNKQEEREACDIVRKYAGEPGFLLAQEAIDIRDCNGMTPLMEAIIHSNFDVSKTFLELGANPALKNDHGLSGFVWGKCTMNPRIEGLLASSSSFSPANNDAHILKKLQNVFYSNPQNRHLFFLGDPPANQNNQSSGSGIHMRMQKFINVILEKKMTFSFEQPALDGLQGFFNSDNLEIKNLLWKTKIFCINVIGLAAGDILPPESIMVLNLFSSGNLIPENVNQLLTAPGGDVYIGIETIFPPFIPLLDHALQNLPEFEGEVFIGTKNLQREYFREETEFQWPTYISSSSLWKVAIENLKDFGNPKAGGEVLIVKSKTGRFLGQYSQHSYDAEVLFPRDTRFRVVAWYRGDVVCLGQSNIREHTFRIKDPEEMNRYMNNNKISLIIKIEEIF